MAFRTRRLLTIDWDAQDLRMALVQLRANGIELLKAVSVPVSENLDASSSEAFGAFLREAIRQSHISNRHAVFCVRRDQVVLNTINLPPAPGEELAAMVLNQITRELPFAADQAAIDFALAADHDPSSPATALVAAVRNEDIEFNRAVANEAGLTLERIGLRPYANRMAVLSSLADAANQTVLFVEIGPQHTEINVLRHGALSFSRSASVSLPSLRDEPGEGVQDSRIFSRSVVDARESERSREAVSRLMVEVIRSFESYRAAESGASVDHIVVCGATGLEAELSQSLAARFAARAALFAPDRMLDITPQRAKELRGFSAVLGLALGHGRDSLVSFDFLRPKKPISRRAVRMKKAPKVALTAALLIGAVVTAYIRFVGEPKALAAEVLEKVQALNADRKRVTALKERLDAVTDWHGAEQHWPEIMVLLTGAFPEPERAQVTRVDFDTREVGRSRNREWVSRVSLKLETAELGVVGEIADAMSRVGFEDVIAGSELPMRGVSRSVYQFESKIDAVIPKRLWKKVGEADSGPEDDGSDAAAEESGTGDEVDGVEAGS